MGRTVLIVGSGGNNKYGYVKWLERLKGVKDKSSVMFKNAMSPDVRMISCWIQRNTEVGAPKRATVEPYVKDMVYELRFVDVVDSIAGHRIAGDAEKKYL